MLLRKFVYLLIPYYVSNFEYENSARLLLNELQYSLPLAMNRDFSTSLRLMIGIVWRRVSFI